MKISSTEVDDINGESIRAEKIFDPYASIPINQKRPRKARIKSNFCLTLLSLMA